MRRTRFSYRARRQCHSSVGMESCRPQVLVAGQVITKRPRPQVAEHVVSEASLAGAGICAFSNGRMRRGGGSDTSASTPRQAPQADAAPHPSSQPTWAIPAPSREGRASSPGPAHTVARSPTTPQLQPTKSRYSAIGRQSPDQGKHQTSPRRLPDRPTRRKTARRDNAQRA
jgi:hypothetical protein